MDEWNAFMDWAMKALMAGVIGYGVHVLSGMKKSIDELNVQVGKIIERTEWHTKELEHLDERISRVEMRSDGQPFKPSHCPS